MLSDSAAVMVLRALARQFGASSRMELLVSGMLNPIGSVAIGGDRTPRGAHERALCGLHPLLRR